MSTSAAAPSADPREVEARFAALQRKLVPLWNAIGRSTPGGSIEEQNTVVVIPSMSIDSASMVG